MALEIIKFRPLKHKLIEGFIYFSITFIVLRHGKYVLSTGSNERLK
jgi:hypothetical protein